MEVEWLEMHVKKNRGSVNYISSKSSLHGPEH